MELPVRQFYNGVWSASEAIDEMARLGFIAAQMEPVNFDPEVGVSAVEIDCHSFGAWRDEYAPQRAPFPAQETRTTPTQTSHQMSLSGAHGHGRPHAVLAHGRRLCGRTHAICCEAYVRFAVGGRCRWFEVTPHAVRRMT